MELSKIASDNAPSRELSTTSETWNRLLDLVLNAVTSPHSRRAYEAALRDFFDWWDSQHRPPFMKATLQAYRAKLEADGLSGSTINVRLSAVRKLATEAADNGLLAPEVAPGIARLKGVKRLGVRAGNWLTLQQAQQLLHAPDARTLKGKRDRAILAVLLGCALRRSEMATLTFEHIQQRDGRWVIVDLVGKGQRVRSVPMPAWVKAAIDDWAQAAGTSGGHVWLSINKGGRAWGAGLSEKVIWNILVQYADAAGLPALAPHDLRRTCAKLCRAAGGDLEQIQIMLGHASVQTTERYLGTKQDLANAPNDRIALNVTT